MVSFQSKNHSPLVKPFALSYILSSACLPWAVHDCRDGFVKKGLTPLWIALLTPPADGIQGDEQMPCHS